MKRFFVLILFLFFTSMVYSQKYTSSEIAVFPNFNIPDHRSALVNTTIEITPRMVNFRTKTTAMTVVILNPSKTRISEGVRLVTYTALLKGKPIVIGYSYDKFNTLLNVGILEGVELVVFIIDKTDLSL